MYDPESTRSETTLQKCKCDCGEPIDAERWQRGVRYVDGTHKKRAENKRAAQKRAALIEVGKAALAQAPEQKIRNTESIW